MRRRTTAGREPAGEEAGTRERILATALDTFGELGFDGTTTRELAARAGVNLGLLQYYFGSKEQLWKEAVARAFAELGAALGEVVSAGATTREGLERILRTHVRFVARRPAFVRLMHDEGKHDGPRMRWLVERHIRPFYETLDRLVTEARRRRLVPPIPTLHLHYVLLGAAGLIFAQGPECRRLTGVDPTDEAFVEAHADAVIRLVLGPPPGESAAATRGRGR